MTTRQSTIVCPACGHREPAEVPDDACWIVYTCAGCGATLRPAAGDCCVFCTHGTVPCPPVQRARTAGGG